MQTKILRLTDKVLEGRRPSFKEADQIYSEEKIPLPDLLWAATRVRERFKKNRIELCSIVNAKSGNCPEDCKFCAQSTRHNADIKIFPLLDESKILKAAKNARQNKASCFGIVTSGKGIRRPGEISHICRAIKNIKKGVSQLKCSVSLGIVDREFLAELKMAGLDRFHHNLETSEDYFSKICTTHTYKERLNTIVAAKEAGLKLCSGGLFGLGEKNADRLKLAFTLRDLDVDSVPLNFLHPIKGTALANARPMAPGEILRTVAIFRIILPKKDIKVCGGRAVNLRSMQAMIFQAGASGMMIGNYLTQAGQEPAVDLQMIQDLGLRIV